MIDPALVADLVDCIDGLDRIIAATKSRLEYNMERRPTLDTRPHHLLSGT